MATGLTLHLSGENAAEVAAALKHDLSAVGYRSEIIDERLAERIGCAASRTLVCEILVGNGVVVLVTTNAVPLPKHRTMVHVVNAADSPSEAVARAISALMDEGMVDTSPTDQRRASRNTIPQPPAHLGYVK